MARRWSGTGLGLVWVLLLVALGAVQQGQHFSLSFRTGLGACCQLESLNTSSDSYKPISAVFLVCVLVFGRVLVEDLLVLLAVKWPNE